MDINLSFIRNDYLLIKLKKYLNQLFQTKKKIIGIVLFGSLARGEAVYSNEKISDIDLIVIFSDKELPKDHIKRTKLEINLMESTLSHIDAIWLTETEFKKLVEIKTDIILYGLDEGKILFDLDGLIKKQKTKLFEELKRKA